MKTETVNFHAQEATRPHQAVAEAAPRHRAPESPKTNRALRAARYLLRRGHAPRHAAAPAPEAPRPTQQVALQYRGAKAERLVSAPVPEDPNLYTGSSVDVTSHMPLLSREQVRDQLGGMEMGALKATVRLPGSKDLLYCFDQSQYNEKGERESSRYAVVSGSQLAQLQDAAVNHKPEVWDQVNEGILYLDATHSSKTVGVGAKRWVPGRVAFPGADATHNLSAPGAAEFPEVSESQAKFFVNPYGRLFISDRAPKQATVVEYNPAYVPATDPWPNGPDIAMEPVIDSSVMMNMSTKEYPQIPVPVAPHHPHQPR